MSERKEAIKYGVNSEILDEYIELNGQLYHKNEAL